MSKQEKPVPLLLVIRIRGTLNVRKDMKATLNSLRLGRVHRATLYKSEPSVLGALQAVKDLVVWGEIEGEVLTKLFEKRARLAGNKPIDRKYLKDNLGVRDFDELAKSLLSFKVDLADLPGVRPFFRLSPPRKGYHLKLERSVKGKASIAGHAGKAINELALRMI